MPGGAGGSMASWSAEMVCMLSSYREYDGGGPLVVAVVADDAALASCERLAAAACASAMGMGET
jgi:hypothetical protein